MSPEEILRSRLDHCEEEVARLKAHSYALWLENDRLQNSFIDINLDCDKKLDEAQEIVVDLMGVIEKLTVSEGTKSYTQSWYPSMATARVWIAQKNK